MADVVEDSTAKIIRLYQSGLSLAEVGNIMNIGHDAIRKRLKKAGVPRRPRGGNNNPKGGASTRRLS